MVVMTARSVDVSVLDLAQDAFVSAGRGSSRDESAAPPLDLLQ